MSQVELLNQTLTLQRFPPMPEETPLQAWEAADEYLLQQVEQPSGPVLIFNDSFGALACALADVRPVSVNDSFIAHQATRHNLRLNDIDDSLVTMQDSLSPLPAAPELVLMKIPKQLALLEQQLRAAKSGDTADAHYRRCQSARYSHLNAYVV